MWCVRIRRISGLTGDFKHRGKFMENSFQMPMFKAKLLLKLTGKVTIKYKILYVKKGHKILVARHITWLHE